MGKNANKGIILRKINDLKDDPVKQAQAIKINYLASKITLASINENKFQLHRATINQFHELLRTDLDKNRIKPDHPKYEEIIKEVHYIAEMTKEELAPIGEVLSPVVSKMVGSEQAGELISNLIPQLLPVVGNLARQFAMGSSGSFRELFKTFDTGIQDFETNELFTVIENIHQVSQDHSIKIDDKTYNNPVENSEFGESLAGMLNADNNVPALPERDPDISKALLKGTSYQNINELFTNLRENFIPKLAAKDLAASVKQTHFQNLLQEPSEQTIMESLYKTIAPLFGVASTIASLDTRIPEQAAIIDKLIDDYVGSQKLAWAASAETNFDQFGDIPLSRQKIQPEVDKAFSKLYKDFDRQGRPLLNKNYKNNENSPSGLTLGLGLYGKGPNTKLYLAFSRRNENKKEFLDQLAQNLSKTLTMPVEALFLNEKQENLRTYLENRIFEKMCRTPAEVHRTIRAYYLENLIKSGLMPFLETLQDEGQLPKSGIILKNRLHQGFSFEDIANQLTLFVEEISKSQMAPKHKQQAALHNRIFDALVNQGPLEEQYIPLFRQEIDQEFGRCCVEEVLSLHTGNKMILSLRLTQASKGSAVFNSTIMQPCVEKCRIFAAAYEYLHEFYRASSIAEYNKLAEAQNKPKLEGFGEIPKARLEKLQNSLAKASDIGSFFSILFEEEACPACKNNNIVELPSNNLPEHSKSDPSIISALVQSMSKNIFSQPVSANNKEDIEALENLCGGPD